MQTYKIILTLTEAILGTVTKDTEVYASYIASKKTDMTAGELAEELETAGNGNLEEKGWTGFHQLEDGSPVIYDYVIKGFFKDACSMLRRVDGTKSKKITAFKKIIDGLVFVTPRRIPLEMNGHKLGVLERPLRAQTAQGERVALARSDTAPAGTRLTFTVEVMGGLDEATLREWLDYGQHRGLGQWRNGGWGTFEYEMEEVVPA